MFERLRVFILAESKHDSMSITHAVMEIAIKGQKDVDENRKKSFLIPSKHFKLLKD